MKRLTPAQAIDPNARWRRRRWFRPCFCGGYSEHIHRLGRRWWA